MLYRFQIRILTGFMLLLFFLSGASPSFSQCKSQADFYADHSVSMPFCEDLMNGCTQTITFDMGCTTIVAPFQVRVIGQGMSLPNGNIPTQNGSEFSIDVSSTFGSFCKGRLVFEYYTSSDAECGIETGFPTGNIRFLDVFKDIPVSALDAKYVEKGLGSTFRIFTETPACITPGDYFNLSVYPIFEGCLQDGIGLDEITWEPVESGFTEITKPLDGSAVTFQAPNSETMAQANDFKVYVGKARRPPFSNSSEHATVRLNRGIREPYPVLSGIPQGTNPPSDLFFNTTQNNQLALGSACMPIDRGGAGKTSDRFTLACMPNDEGAGATYLWTVPPQFELVNGTTTSSRVIQVEARNRTDGESGASGTFTCTVNAPNSCGSNSIMYTITRSLVATTQQTSPASTYNEIEVTPTPGQGLTEANCFRPNTDYTFTLLRAPLNTILEWSNTTVSTTESYWNVVGHPSFNSITLRPVVVGNDLDLPLSVSSLAPCDADIHFKVNTLDPQLAGNSIPLEIEAEENNGLVRVINPTGSNPPDWYPGGSGCSFSDFAYFWTFEGTFNGIQKPSSELFSSQTSPSPSVESGLYNGTFRVVIQTATNPIGCPEANCFFEELTKTVNYNMRPAGPGGEEESASGLRPSLQLQPNPASEELQIAFSRMSSGGVLRIYNGMQVLVRELEGVPSETVLDLKGLPPGIYSVEYLSPDGERAGRRLSKK
jgi:hypothetical protein